MVGGKTDRSAELHVVGEYPGVHRVGLWHNVCIVVWFGPATGAAARKLGPIAQTMIDQLDGLQLSYIHVILDGIALPDAATRDGLLEITRAYSSHVACVAVLIAGTGFWASAFRGFVTGFRVLAPRTFSLRIHTAAAELLEWFPKEHERRTGVALDPSQLAQTLERACSWRSAHAS